MDKIYFIGEFEAVSLKFIDSLQKFKKNNDKKVIFLFNDSKIMSFEERKSLLEQHLQGLNYEIVRNKNPEYENIGKDIRKYFENEDFAEMKCDHHPTYLSISNKLKHSFSVSHVKNAKFIYLKDVDAPLNYVKYILEKHYFIYDKIANLMSEKRYKHTVSVALTAIEIAINNGITPKKAFIAAMLHDIAKDTCKDVVLKIMRKSFRNRLNEEEVVYHQFVGTILARKLFKIYNRDILRSIEYHTTGNKNMSNCAKIVYCADKIEPTRGYDSKYMIYACKEDITRGFKLVLHENIEFLRTKNVKLGDLTKNAIKFYDIESFKNI